ncbi:MAG: pyruvate kinase [Thermoleophilaceae bacterium]|nr:pyruvate kinase [Thermoleophilaceae bacterium]
MRSTKIVATIGPASREPEVLERLVAAGLDVARLNFAHGSATEHAETADRIRAAAERVGRVVAILGDLPGPKLRLGPVAGGVAELGRGADVVLSQDQSEGTADRLPVAWKGLGDLVQEGDVAYLADGAVRLRVKDVRDGDVNAEVEVGGSVASRQGINLPNVTVSLPAVSEDDLALVDAGIDMGLDFLALSFVRRGEDLEPVRKRLRERGHELPLIAKIEKPQAAANAEEIIEHADGVMIARGDLGIELPIEEVPLVQKRILAMAGRSAVPTITATQMLESMVHSVRPTRAEVADVANAIFDGTDAVMLSQETAVGKYPVEAVAMMASIAESTERELPYGRWLAERGPQANNQYHAISFGAVAAVYQLGLKAIVSPTRTGTTVRLISSYRPQAPVLALSMHPDVVRQCCLLWGVKAALNEEPQHTTELIDSCAQAAVDEGLAKPGDMIGITAGLPAGRSGGTNLFKVHVVE